MVMEFLQGNQGHQDHRYPKAHYETMDRPYLFTWVKDGNLVGEQSYQGRNDALKALAVFLAQVVSLNAETAVGIEITVSAASAMHSLRIHPGERAEQERS